LQRSTWPVEIYFTARSMRLLQSGVAAGLNASAHPKAVYDGLREAVAHGAVLYAAVMLCMSRASRRCR